MSEQRKVQNGRSGNGSGGSLGSASASLLERGPQDKQLERLRPGARELIEKVRNDEPTSLSEAAISAIKEGKLVIHVVSQNDVYACYVHPNGGGLLEITSVASERSYIGDNALVTGNSKVDAELVGRVRLGNANVVGSRVENSTVFDSNITYATLYGRAVITQGSDVKGISPTERIDIRNCNIRNVKVRSFRGPGSIASVNIGIAEEHVPTKAAERIESDVDSNVFVRNLSNSDGFVQNVRISPQ